MTTCFSIATQQRYPCTLICAAWDISRSNVYFLRTRQEANRPAAQRRGPTGPCSDAVLLKRIREVLNASPFHSEGYRKVWARLRAAGTRTSKDRVRRLMRDHGLQAPYFPVREHGSKAHDGRITTDQPDEMWGTDMTSTQTIEDGQVAVFAAVEHCTGECVGIHAAVHGDRFEALEPLRQGIREHFGGYEADVAAGLTVRHDHGSQYTSRAFQAELSFLGIASSPSFVAEPECNGVAERFFRTLKEQCLWLKTFQTVDELQQELEAFRQRYNDNWLVQKHQWKTPNNVRASFSTQAAAA